MLDGKGCLRLGQGGGVIVWPHDHSVDVEPNGVVRIRDREGRAVAKVGDDVVIGGGEVGERGMSYVDAGPVPSEQELLERCPGEYYLSSGEVGVQGSTP